MAVGDRREAGIPGPPCAPTPGSSSTRPAAAVGWTTLAGIGWVESHHGTIGGRVLGAAGRSSRPILGPALNGRGRFAAIPATPDSGAFHGDPVGARRRPDAVPPGVVGDLGGRRRRRRCRRPARPRRRGVHRRPLPLRDGDDLATGSGWEAAVLSYNHAQDYVDAVHAAATAYADRSG